VTALRSEDWSVRPSFVPNGPTSPVALLADDAGLTQLAGIPPVAWQTPWSEISALELVRFAHSMALFATVAGVRYCWRHRELADFEDLRAVVLAHGGVVRLQRRRVGVAAVAAAVLVASFAGGIVAWLYHSGAHAELNDAKSVNLTLKDLPSGWYAANEAVLSYLVPPANQVFTSTTTTTPTNDTSFTKAATLFQTCLGVTDRADRVYGRAGQLPDYQVSSKILETNSLGGVELASTTQYYATATMVKKDTAEMSKPDFGKCFAVSSAALLLAGFGASAPSPSTATNWRPATFLKGWSRGGVVAFAIPDVTTNVHLVEVVITHGHYEVTLDALVASLTKTETLLAQLVDTLLGRMTSSSSQAV
jgi:hypothetical protein